MEPRKLWRILPSLLLIVVLTTSCSLFTPKEVPVPVFVEKSVELKELPRPLSLLLPKFEVVSEAENLSLFLEGNKIRNGNIVFIALDVIEYEKLALNTAEIHRYITQLLAVVQYYEERVTKKEPKDE